MRPARRGPLAALALPLALSLACGVSALLPTPTVRPRATVTPPAPYLAWPLVLRDYFLSEANAWEFGQQDDALARGNLAVQSGKYVFDITAKDGVIWWSRALEDTATSDFYLAVDTRHASGTPDADSGLVFRHDGANYYYFQVSQTAGQYALYVYAQEVWTELIPWTASSLIHTDETNRLAVLGEGPQLTLYINGQLVDHSTDDRVPAGAAGVAVQIYNGDESAVFEFDNFEWRAPAEAVVRRTPTPAP